MKISTKGRYGLRALVDLAFHSTGEQITLYSIASRQELSVNYLEQVFSTLRKHGIVKSIKGAQGGYILAKDPADIKVGDVLRAIEGDISLVDEDIDQLPNGPLRNLQFCIQEKVWKRINESINSVIDEITLADLVKDYQSMNTEEGFMYYI